MVNDIRAIYVLFFFFQAEDGIRDLTVTGVQTCALPILARLRPDDQIDVGDLIPVAYQRLAKEEIRCHNYLPIRMGSTSFTAGRHECGVESSAARGVWKAAPSRVCG